MLFNKNLHIKSKDNLFFNSMRPFLGGFICPVTVCFYNWSIDARRYRLVFKGFINSVL